MIKVSLIIPVYNVVKYIDRCLDSVMNQEYPDIECILVDDYTPDNSFEIINKKLDAYSGRIDFKIVRHKENRGLSAARNSGVKVATGDYIFFLDSDDQLVEGAIESFVDAIIEYGSVDFLIGDYQVIGNWYYRGIQSEKYLSSNVEIFSDYLSGKWYVMAWGKLINRSFFEKYNLWFVEGLLHEDELFSFRLAFFSNRMVYVNKNIYRYFIRNDSIMGHKRYKNYIDHLFVISENLKLSRSLKFGLSDSNIGCYFISVFYGIMFSVINNSSLNIVEKRELIHQIQKNVKELRRDIVIHTFKTHLEYHILSSHYSVVNLVMKCYFYFCGIKYKRYEC